jgi:hypothetical protein
MGRQFSSRRSVNNMKKRQNDFDDENILDIVDESSLHDFTGFSEWDLTDIQKKIRDVHDLNISDLEPGNLLEIFKRIRNKLHGASCL